MREWLPELLVYTLLVTAAVYAVTEAWRRHYRGRTDG